jgi:NAD(P)-dependent dehydrogenase (short-subunit alcohol dehydrogenase family)
MSNDLFDLTGKNVLVTGGAQGLGRMIAEGLLRAGATVAITSRKADICEAAAAEMAALGKCIALPADLSTPEAAVDLANRYRSTVASTLHVLVNNAGKTWGGPVDSFPDRGWPGVMMVNVQTPFTLVREFLPELTAAGTPDDPARVINIGSIAGAKTARLSAYSYSASKAAVHMLSRDLAGDLADRNINVNAVMPGFFPTSMTAHMRDDEAVDTAVLAQIPMRRMGRADEIAGTVVFMSSRASAYITGAEIPVDGGIVGCG